MSWQRLRASILPIVCVVVCFVNYATAQEDGMAVDSTEVGGLRIAGVGLNVSDIDRSNKFYSEVLGLSEVMRVPAEGPTVELVLSVTGKIDGAIVVLAKLDDQPLVSGREGFGRIILNVPNASMMADRAKEAGAAVTKYETGAGGPVVYFVEDPDGYKVELYQPPTND